MNLISVVFPVYNNLDVIKVTLPAILNQTLPIPHEVVVVDDGSGPDLRGWLAQQDHPALHVATHSQNKGRSAARNTGFRASKGDALVFLDSDVITRPDFLAAHAAALTEGGTSLSLGRLSDVVRLDPPEAATTDPIGGHAHFTTANVGIPRALLERVQETPLGPFDEATFTRYGWEDLELERRLRAHAPRRMRHPAAAGLHHCAPFAMADLPGMIAKEVDRAVMARAFYAKHPVLAVRMMAQMTPLHRVVWEIFSLGGLLNARSLGPLLHWLVAQGRVRLALVIARHCILNPAYIRAL
jgi:glycosyltransferase involved in cell wall biosynthesis